MRTIRRLTVAGGLVLLGGLLWWYAVWMVDGAAWDRAAARCSALPDHFMPELGWLLLFPLLALAIGTGVAGAALARNQGPAGRNALIVSTIFMAAAVALTIALLMDGCPSA